MITISYHSQTVRLMSYYPCMCQTSRDSSSYICLFIAPRHSLERWESNFSFSTPKRKSRSECNWKQISKLNKKSLTNKSIYQVIKLCQLLWLASNAEKEWLISSLSSRVRRALQALLVTFISNILVFLCPDIHMKKRPRPLRCSLVIVFPQRLADTNITEADFSFKMFSSSMAFGRCPNWPWCQRLCKSETSHIPVEQTWHPGAQRVYHAYFPLLYTCHSNFI